MITIHCTADFGTDLKFHAEKQFKAEISEIKGNEQRIIKRLSGVFDAKYKRKDKQNLEVYYYDQNGTERPIVSSSNPT